ncbi:putative Regulatory protein TetR [Desulfosarcina cetonica]|uniref:TetR/AcrR family transcriptional regulator n=1 Tax=Desulfosarcina cetonica TaxID=90730 RepID=UPI0006D201AC|nr:TetR/AcrR family transcriptional regulator [Desulfosarcina cetonica]VTR70375.1 putative Regulatory protein TetR [Desulfosarcina cetonica]
MSRIIEEPETLHERILNAARDLFSHFGFKKTAVDDIAKKARVAKGTVYNYFQSKEDLFQKVFREEGVNMISQIREAVKNKKTPQDKFREMIIAKIKYYKEFCLVHDISHQRAGALLPFLDQERDDITRNEIKIIKEILEEGVNNSVFQVKNISVTAKALAIAIKGLEVGWTLEMELEDASAEIDSLLMILFHGLESRSGNR